MPFCVLRALLYQMGIQVCFGVAQHACSGGVIDESSGRYMNHLHIWFKKSVSLVNREGSAKPYSKDRATFDQVEVLETQVGRASSQSTSRVCRVERNRLGKLLDSISIRYQARGLNRTRFANNCSSLECPESSLFRRCDLTAVLPPGDVNASRLVALDHTTLSALDSHT